jgi:serine/threonine protein phosphatase PrpC
VERDGPPAPAEPEGPAEPAAAQPAFGRPSPASLAEPVLRPEGDAATASWRAEAASTDWCWLRAASVAGVRHRLAGHAPEDSYAWAHRDGILVVAVTDGVGSLDGSAGAAARAARAAADAGCRQGGDPEDAVRAAIEAADRAAEGGGATTVVVAVLDRAGRGMAARVGDSTAIVISGDATGAELFDRPDPERADAATRALPDPTATPETQAFQLAPGSILVLVTDGIGDPWRDGPTTAGPALVDGLLRRPGPLELLALADFSRQGCHDDRTILAVWPAPGATTEAPDAGPDPSDPA